MNADDLLVWGSLHDGELRLAEGRVPGDVALHVAIPYLREHFTPAGEGFVLRLSQCTRLQLVRDDGEVLNDPAMIASRAPVLLSIISEAPLAIYTSEGMLTLEYASLALALDTGEALAPDALDAASADYWQRWNARTNAHAAPSATDTRDGLAPAAEAIERTDTRTP